MSADIRNSHRTSYSAMGNDRHDYEACYSYHERWDLFGLHCHDFYELYIHLKGAKFYCIDDRVYPLSNFDLMVVPPFRIHGLICESPPTGYERCFLYITPAMLKVCGGGQLDLEFFLNHHIQSGALHFPMTPEEGQECKELMQTLSRTQEDNAPLARFDNYAKLLRFLNIIFRAMNRSNKTVGPSS